MKTRAIFSLSLLIFTANSVVNAEELFSDYPAPAPSYGTAHGGYLTDDPGVINSFHPRCDEDCNCGSWPTPQSICCEGKFNECPDEFEFTLDYTVYSRSSAAAQNILSDAVTAAPLFDVGALDFEFEHGMRSRLVHDYCPCRSIELGYLGLFEAVESGSAASANNVDANFFGTNPTAGTSPGFVRYTTELHSIDLNMHHHWNDHLAFLWGFRWADMHEDFNILTQEDPAVGGISDTDNSLYAFQIGGVFGFQVGRWKFDSYAKAGVFHNRARVSAEFGGASFAHTEEQVGMWAEAEISGRYCINEHASIKVGYWFAQLDGVALAPNQNDNFALATGAGNMEFDKVTYHGLTIGLELVW